MNSADPLTGFPSVKYATGSFFVSNFVMSLNQRAAMRWLVDLDLLLMTSRLETAFGLVACDVETLLAAEFDEGKNGE